MADTPPRGLPPTPAAPFWPPTPPNPPRSSPSWLGGAALTVATAALAVGILGWFRPAPPPPAQEPVFTEQQVEAAKERACAAFELVQRGVRLQTQGEPSDDPGLRKAQSANAQLALFVGSWYLRDQLSPETPPSLASAINDLANSLLTLSMTALAGEQPTDQEQTASTSTAEELAKQIAGICK
ncbi:hypothetical protein ABQE69_03305 [Mycolicibacillus trivialis]